jgi:hypothetical protein
VDAEPVAANLDRLLALPGVGIHDVASASGISIAQLRTIQRRQCNRVRVTTAHYLTRVTPEMLTRHRYFATDDEARRCRQQILSLNANGWTLHALGERIGRTRQGMSYLLTTGHRLLREVVLDIDRLYRGIGDRPGGSKRAASLARKAGHWPPIFYDDDMRLIPEAIPDGQQPEWLAQSDRARLRFEACQALLAGLSVPATARQVGTSERQVSRWRKDLGWTTSLPNEGIRIIRDAVERASTADSDTLWGLWKDTCVRVQAAAEDLEAAS